MQIKTVGMATVKTKQKITGAQKEREPGAHVRSMRMQNDTAAKENSATVQNETKGNIMVAQQFCFWIHSQ